MTNRTAGTGWQVLLPSPGASDLGLWDSGEEGGSGTERLRPGPTDSQALGWSPELNWLGGQSAQPVQGPFHVDAKGTVRSRVGRALCLGDGPG